MLNIAGIPVIINKKDIKNMHLYVKPPHGQVSVSAPHLVSDMAIERFVRTRLHWVKKQIACFNEQARQSEREHSSGETFYVWGKQYLLQIEYGKAYSLVLSNDKAIFTVRKNSTSDQRENFLRKWYRAILKVEIEKQMPKWEAKTGLKASSWQIKYMTTKWGSCNFKTGKIWLNLQLAKKTYESLDYIILHELMHLKEKTHNKRFIALMDKYMPMWREIKATLNGEILDFME